MTYDLTKTEDRIEALKQLNGEFKQALKDAGVKLHDNTIVGIYSSHIEISIEDTDPESSYFNNSAFASEIYINCDELSTYKASSNKISMSSVGAFDPNDNDIQKLRMIHMGSLIEHWENVSKLTTEYCQKHIELCKEIKKVNKK